MFFSEEEASSERKCTYCKHKIRKGSICWRTYEYRDWKNICIVCISKVVKGYMDEFNSIIKRIKIKRI